MILFEMAHSTKLFLIVQFSTK